MKFPRYKITHMPELLHRLGVVYHQTSVIESKDGVKLYDCYMVSRGYSERVLRLLQRINKDITVLYGKHRYAPELKEVMLCFPKAGFYRQ